MSENIVALVTGVSSGISREIARLLAENGARVLGTVRDIRSVADVSGGRIGSDRHRRRTEEQ
jgi:NAD(P)-dependent dehydrogenase (short-subunit alcohol dehydrogenase family)